jgi:hypothetical protein
MKVVIVRVSIQPFVSLEEILDISVECGREMSWRICIEKLAEADLSLEKVLAFFGEIMQCLCRK